jgi:hypothetical protein
VALSGTCTNCTAEEATEEATEHSAEHPTGSDAAPGEQEAHQ